MKAKRFRYRGTRTVREGESYLRSAARYAMKNLSIKQLVEEMRGFADANPYHLGVGDPAPYRRDVRIDGHVVHVMFSKTTLSSGRAFYQLSIGNDQNIPAATPAHIREKLRVAFVPRGMMIPSMMGNCYQYLEQIP